MLFAFAACSDDSASASNSGEENLESSNDLEQESSSSAQSSSSWKELSSAVIIDISQFKNDDTTVVDSVNNAVYSTVVIGPYKWIKETIRIESDSVKSTCYDYDDDNCEKYGRLYYNRYSIGKYAQRDTALQAGEHTPIRRQSSNFLPAATAKRTIRWPARTLEPTATIKQATAMRLS